VLARLEKEPSTSCWCGYNLTFLEDMSTNVSTFLCNSHLTCSAKMGCLRPHVEEHLPNKCQARSLVLGGEKGVQSYSLKLTYYYYYYWQLFVVAKKKKNM
jgi:hypothetical protein